MRYPHHPGCPGDDPYPCNCGASVSSNAEPDDLQDLDPGKYITFKRAELLALLETLGWPQAERQALLDLELEETTVIRHQDVFAGPGLAAYANSIVATVAAFKVLNDRPWLQGHLMAYADFIQSRAHAADDHPSKKLPD